MIKKASSIISIFGLATVLSGCSNVPYMEHYMSRTDSPEITNEPLKVKAALVGNKMLHIPVNSQDSIDPVINVDLKVDVSLFKGLEASITTGDESSYKLKYQWLGAPANTAEAGNVSFTTSIGALKYKNKDAAPAGEPGWSVDQTMLDVAVILGVRMSNEALLYGSIFHQFGDAKTTITPRAYNPNTVMDWNHHCEDFSDQCVGNTFEVENKATGFNLAVEYQTTKSTSVTAEYISIDGEWFGRKHKDSSITLKLEYQF